jgi:predicted acylesterase/phospholipase RssA
VAVGHLVASCAIPLVYGPVRIEVLGERLWAVDGGVFERLPLATAIKAGATEMVSVDVLAEAPSRLLRGFLTAVSHLRQALAPDVCRPALSFSGWQWPLNPQQKLGALSDSVRWDRQKIARWIEAGYREAAARLDKTSAAQPASPSRESAAPE